MQAPCAVRPHRNWLLPYNRPRSRATPPLRTAFSRCCSSAGGAERSLLQVSPPPPFNMTATTPFVPATDYDKFEFDADFIGNGFAPPAPPSPPRPPPPSPFPPGAFHARARARATMPYANHDLLALQ